MKSSEISAGGEQTNQNSTNEYAEQTSATSEGAATLAEELVSLAPQAAAALEQSQTMNIQHANSKTAMPNLGLRQASFQPPKDQQFFCPVSLEAIELEHDEVLWLPMKIKPPSDSVWYAKFIDPENDQIAQGCFKPLKVSGDHGRQMKHYIRNYEINPLTRESLVLPKQILLYSAPDKATVLVVNSQFNRLLNITELKQLVQCLHHQANEMNYVWRQLVTEFLSVQHIPASEDFSVKEVHESFGDEMKLIARQLQTIVQLKHSIFNLLSDGEYSLSHDIVYGGIQVMQIIHEQINKLNLHQLNLIRHGLNVRFETDSSPMHIACKVLEINRVLMSYLNGGDRRFNILRRVSQKKQLLLCKNLVVSMINRVNAVAFDASSRGTKQLQKVNAQFEALKHFGPPDVPQEDIEHIKLHLRSLERQLNH